MPFGNQLWVLFEGVGVKRARSAALRPPTFDELAEAVGDSFVWKWQVKISEKLQFIIIR